MANRIDPASKTPNRIRRNWNHAITGSLLASLNLTAPVALTVDGTSLRIRLGATGGLTTSSSDLVIKLNTNSGLALAAGGLSVVVDTTTIAITSGTLGLANNAVTLTKFGWATTKGDLLVYDGAAYQRLPAGTNGQVLTANSTAPTGLQWV